MPNIARQPGTRSQASIFFQRASSFLPEPSEGVGGMRGHSVGVELVGWGVRVGVEWLEGLGEFLRGCEE